jgi:glycine C-acetyltransferase
MSTTRIDPLGYLTPEIDALKAQGVYRHLRVLEDEQRAHTTFDGRSVVNLSSNNYLGLTTHPRLRERAMQALERYGVGTWIGADDRRHDDLHVELERRLAEFKQTEATVVFQSGFTANAGTVSALLTKDDVIISDELNHASIIDGCRLSRAAIKVFPHKDVDAARRIPARASRVAAEAASSRTGSSAWTATSARCPGCAPSPKSTARS